MFAFAVKYARLGAMKYLRRRAADIVGHCIRLFARFITAVRADWQGIEPVPRQRIYFANHSSNGDMPMIWSVLPPALRREVRPVAAADYWLKTPLRAFVGPEVFNAVRRKRFDRPQAGVDLMTETTTDILFLAFGAFGILIALTILGEVLRARQPAHATNPVLETYITRVHSWWGMVAFIGLALLTGKIGVMLLFAFASFAALREFLTLTTKAQADHLSLALAFFVILPLQYIFIAMEWSGLYSIFIPVYGFLLLPIVSAMRGDANRYLIRVAETQWGLMITVFCLSHVPALMNLDIYGDPERSVLLVAFLVHQSFTTSPDIFTRAKFLNP